MTKLARRHHAGLSFDWFTCKRLGPPRASLDAASPVNSAAQRAENEREEERNDLSIAGPRHPVFPRACRRPRRPRSAPACSAISIGKLSPPCSARPGGSRPRRSRRSTAPATSRARATRTAVVTTPQGFREAYRRWAEAGWAGVTASPEYGGMGLPHAVNFACTEIWNGASMGFALCPLLSEGALGALNAHGSPDSARDLHAQDDQRRMDRHDEPDGAAGGLRPQRGQDARRAGRRRNLSRLRPEDLHHLWRARSRRQHRAPGARAAARRAARHARASRCSSCRNSWSSRTASLGARNDVRCAEHRAQAGHPRLADLRHDLWRRRRRDGLARRRGEPRPRRDVRDDEQRAARRSACRAWRSASAPISMRSPTPASAAKDEAPAAAPA